MFDQDYLKKKVEETLKPIPPEHNHAIIGFVNDKGEVKLTYVRRMGTHGEFGVVAEKTKVGGFGAGAFVKASW